MHIGLTLGDLVDWLTCDQRDDRTPVEDARRLRADDLRHSGFPWHSDSIESDQSPQCEPQWNDVLEDLQ